ncbi:MAG TPA: hypothetical protein VD908_16895 [Cytophagales bacterium]|nr:hypothetical protein [Cytophagales bacterium]
MQLPKDLVEVYSTEKGCVYQSDSQNAFWIEFGGKMTAYKTNCFLKLKGTVDNINLAQRITCLHSADCEIIKMGKCNDFYVLTLCELVAFKELINGAKVMLELNSIIKERLYFTPAYIG